MCYIVNVHYHLEWLHVKYLLSIFTADCLRHPIQMAGTETIYMGVAHSFCHILLTILVTITRLVNRLPKASRVSDHLSDRLILGRSFQANERFLLLDFAPVYRSTCVLLGIQR